eukprot:TRINITY_DN10767_c0_g1_i3.p1 TRINITY_DN10767_c0_g1~~TRINITY_DN10767_c0_g1_i3.p1  ORF type:complete len:301 (+),score=43.60 TRINITY_DN10767_c0_g1_i3:329-1231(+)
MHWYCYTQSPVPSYNHSRTQPARGQSFRSKHFNVNVFAESVCQACFALRLKQALASLTDPENGLPLRTVLVLDMHSLGSRHREGRFVSWLRHVLGLIQTLLPYTFEHVVIPHPPKSISLIMLTISSLLDPSASVHILDRGHDDRMTEFVEPPLLARYRGGTVDAATTGVQLGQDAFQQAAQPAAIELPEAVSASKSKPLVIKLASDIAVGDAVEWCVWCNGEVEVVLELWSESECWLRRKYINCHTVPLCDGTVAPKHFARIKAYANGWLSHKVAIQILDKPPASAADDNEPLFKSITFT